MSGQRQAQGVEGAHVVQSGTPVEEPTAPRFAEAYAQALALEVIRAPFVFIDELAEKLDTTVRTIQKQIRAGTFFLDELPHVDRKHRWSRASLYRQIEITTLRSHREKVVRDFRIRKAGVAAK